MIHFGPRNFLGEIRLDRSSSVDVGSHGFAIFMAHTFKRTSTI